MLGKGITQKQAIKEILMFPFNNLLRQQVLELLVDYHFSLKTKDTKTPDDEEWLMHLSPAYLKWREETLQQGIQQGIDQGIQQERRRFIENLLKSRFEKFDDELKSVIEPLLQLPTEESSRLLLQASREELLVRFKH
jgi:endonuclease III